MGLLDKLVWRNVMKEMLRLLVLLGLTGSLAVAIGGIPEPDAMLYGGATINSVAVVQQQDVSVIARMESGVEVGRFGFSDCNANGVRDVCEISCSAPNCAGVTGCGTARDSNPADGLLDDCAGHLYVLRIRSESVPSGLTASGNAVILNSSEPPVVQVFIQEGTGPERYVRDFTVSQRGKIKNLTAMPLTTATYSVLARCLGGPDNSDPLATCDAEAYTTADYTEDLFVDLRDFAFIQNSLVPE